MMMYLVRVDILRLIDLSDYFDKKHANLGFTKVGWLDGQYEK